MSHWAKQYDSPLRWAVRSQTSKNIYVVDLGHWECQCKWAITQRHKHKVNELSDPRVNNLCFHKQVALNCFFKEYVRPACETTPILRHLLTHEHKVAWQPLTFAFVDEYRHNEEADEENTPTPEDSPQEQDSSQTDPDQEDEAYLHESQEWATYEEEVFKVY